MVILLNIFWKKIILNELRRFNHELTFIVGGGEQALWLLVFLCFRWC